MRHLAAVVCCLLVIGFAGPSAPVAGQIPTSRPRTTQAPPPANTGAPKTTPDAKSDAPTKEAPPKPAAAPPAQLPPKEAPAGSTFPDLQRQIADALKQNQIPRALALAERQRTLYPNEMKATADLASVLLLRGETAKAEPLLRTASTQKSVLYTGNTAALLGDVYMSLGQIALDSGRATDAISFLLRAVDNAPTATRARYLLAAALDRSGDGTRAAREIRAAFEFDPEAARPADYRLLAKTAKAGGNVKAAADALKGAVRRFPMDVSLRLDYAASLTEAKLPAEALYELLHLKMVVRGDASQIADIDARVDRLRQEAEASTPEPDPQLESMFSYLADADADQHDAALPTIQEVVTMNGGASLVPLLMLGRSLKATGRFGEAERVFAQLAEREPQSVPVLAELADLFFAEGRFEGARRAVARAEKIDPKNPRLIEVVAFWK